MLLINLSMAKLLVFLLISFPAFGFEPHRALVYEQTCELELRMGKVPIHCYLVKKFKESPNAQDKLDLACAKNSAAARHSEIKAAGNFRQKISSQCQKSIKQRERVLNYLNSEQIPKSLKDLSPRFTKTLSSTNIDM